MSLVTVIIVLVCVGILLYCVEAFVPMNATIKRILMAVVILVVVWWLLNAFGIVDALRVPVSGRHPNR